MPRDLKKIPVTYLCWGCGSSKTVMEDVDARLPVPAVEQWIICPECRIKDPTGIYEELKEKI